MKCIEIHQGNEPETATVCLWVEEWIYETAGSHSFGIRLNTTEELTDVLKALAIPEIPFLVRNEKESRVNLAVYKTDLRDCAYYASRERLNPSDLTWENGLWMRNHLQYIPSVVAQIINPSEEMLAHLKATCENVVNYEPYEPTVFTSVARGRDALVTFIEQVTGKLPVWVITNTNQADDYYAASDRGGSGEEEA